MVKIIDLYQSKSLSISTQFLMLIADKEMTMVVVRGFEIENLIVMMLTFFVFAFEEVSLINVTDPISIQWKLPLTSGIRDLPLIS